MDARIICATNKDLEVLVREGKFREDLYYRINTITIRVPALRDRREDILPLAQHFLSHYSLALGKRMTGFTDQATNALCAYSWPGNVRELRNVIERAVVLSSTDLISPDGLPRQMLAHAEDEGIATDSKIEQMEKTMLLDVMRKNRGNVSSAARELGISRDTLRYRIRKYRLEAG